MPEGCGRWGGRAPWSLGPRAALIGVTALWLGAWAGAAPAANAETATFGKTTVGAQREVFGAERKRERHDTNDERERRSPGR